MIDKVESKSINENLVLLSTAAYTCSPPPTPTSSNTAIADTGASGHYFMPSAPVSNIDHTAPTLSASTATGQLLHSTATATLNLPQLPPGSTTGHIMPTFTNNLISIGRLCDADCHVHFSKTRVDVRNKHNTSILQGTQERDGAKM